MSNAKLDNNRVATLIASSNADGETILLTYETGNCLSVIDATTGTDYGNDPIVDQNRKPVLLAVSESDGVTPIVVYADASTNSLLIRST